MLFEKGAPARRVRQPGAGDAARGRHPRHIEQQWLSDVVGVPVLSEPHRRHGRRARAQRRARRAYAAGCGARSATVATVSALLFFGLLAVVVVSSPGWPPVRETFFDWADAQAAARRARGFWLNVRLFLIAEPLILVLGAPWPRRGHAPPRRCSRCGSSPSATPTCSAGCRRSSSSSWSCFGIPALQLQGVTNDTSGWPRRARAVLRRLRRRGLPGRHRVDPPVPGRQRRRPRALARPGDAPRRGAPGHPPGDAAAAQRLRLAAEGHRAAVVGRRLRGAVRGARTTRTTTSTTRRTSSSLCCFVALTIPLARFTDWIGRRAMRRERAGAR